MEWKVMTNKIDIFTKFQFPVNSLKQTIKMYNKITVIQTIICYHKSLTNKILLLKLHYYPTQCVYITK